MDGAVMENRRTPTGLQEDNDDFWLIFGRGSRGALRHD